MFRNELFGGRNGLSRRLEAFEFVDGGSGRTSDILAKSVEFPSKRSRPSNDRLGEIPRGSPDMQRNDEAGNACAAARKAKSARRDSERIGNVNKVSSRTVPSLTFGMLRNSSRNSGRRPSMALKSHAWSMRCRLDR